MAGMTMCEGPSWRKLDDPFAQVGFGHHEAFFFQVVVEEGFFRGHRLAFDDFLDPVGPGNIGNDGVGLKGGVGNVHLDPGGFGAGFESGEELLEIGDGGILPLQRSRR